LAGLPEVLTGPKLPPRVALDRHQTRNCGDEKEEEGGRQTIERQAVKESGEPVA